MADTSLHKFMLFEGEGANGKTVACVVLRVLLGDSNVSSVGLEAFNPNRTFALAATDGKLANIVGEMNEVDRTAEGLLKSFVAGEHISVERKFRDPYDLVPSARITFATNVLPTFNDRSDGLWRRMILVPFKNQILDVTKQDRRLVEPEFWIKSGELPGILNWSLEGLKRLRQRGHFSEPAVSQAAKADYKFELNPARSFLVDECELDQIAEISTQDLYNRYGIYMNQAGHKGLSRTKFAKEVKRAFPSAKGTDNAVLLPNGSRSRLWKGIKLKV